MVRYKRYINNIVDDIHILQCYRYSDEPIRANGIIYHVDTENGTYNFKKFN